MRSMQWQLGILETISAFAYRHRESKENLCRGGRSQDLPNTDLYTAVRHNNINKNRRLAELRSNKQRGLVTHTEQSDESFQ